MKSIRPGRLTFLGIDIAALDGAAKERAAKDAAIGESLGIQPEEMLAPQFSNRATIEATEEIFKAKLEEGMRSIANATMDRAAAMTPRDFGTLVPPPRRADMLETLFGIPIGPPTVLNCRCAPPDLGDQALFGRHGREGSPEHREARRPLKARKWVSKAAGTVRGGEYGAPGICPYCGESCVGVDGCEPPVHMACDGEAGFRVGAEGAADDRAYDRPGYLLRWDNWEQTRTTGRRRPSWRNERAWRTKTREIPRLHGFGFKMQGLDELGGEFDSADSMAWSYNGRRNGPLPTCTHPGRCANCLTWAMDWRRRLAERVPLEG